MNAKSVIAVMIALLAVSLAPCLSHAEDARALTVILVRHAEKESAGSDPSLSVAGVKRAERLAAMLAASGIAAIFTSQFQRTQQTAAPLARALGLKPEAVAVTKDAARPDHMDRASLTAIAGRVRAASSPVLVVGHSTTLPDIIEELGGRGIEPIDEATGFDNLFIVTVVPGARASVLHLKY